MRKLTIFVDMDDVLTDLLTPWLHRLNKISSYTHTSEDINVWDMRKHYPDVSPAILYGMLDDWYFWENVKPIEGAYTYLKKIVEDGHNVKIATASSPHSFYEKVTKCLLKHFDFIPSKDVICINDKSLLRGDVLIDDYHENLRKFQGVRILKNAPYNKDCDDVCYHFRADNWKIIYEIVKELSNIDEML